MDTNTAIIVSMVLPILACISNLLHGNNRPNLRDGITLLTAIATFGCVLSILINNGGGSNASLYVISVMPGLDIAFHIEPLGLLFALIASGLWVVVHIYAIGYMRGNNEDNHARFFAAFCFSISATLGIAFSSNMFSLFVFMKFSRLRPTH